MLQNCSSTNSIQGILENIMNEIDSQIQIKETLKQLPPFLNKIIIKQLYQNIFPVAQTHEAPNYLVEEPFSSVPKIAKDTLMPKDVETQKDENENFSPKQSALNLKQLSSLTKKISTANSRTMKSVTFTERRSIRDAKKNQTPCTILPVDQNQQDYQVTRLRQKTEMRIRFDMQCQRLSLFRQKSFKEKSKMLDELIGQQAQAAITHDYQGQQLKSIIADDKIKHYSMQAQFGTMMRNKKQEQFNKPIEMSIEINKNKEKDHPNKLVKPMEMPLFPVQQKDYSHLHQIKHYKLHDYKKHFGRKYSRLDQYSQTLQLSRIHHKQQQKQEIFSQRKHLRDSSLLQASREVRQSKGPVRRLALPRLHGKYKVLDRYDQV